MFTPNSLFFLISVRLGNEMRFIVYLSICAMRCFKYGFMFQWWMQVFNDNGKKKNCVFFLKYQIIASVYAQGFAVDLEDLGSFQKKESEVHCH